MMPLEAFLSRHLLTVHGIVVALGLIVYVAVARAQPQLEQLQNGFGQPSAAPVPSRVSLMAPRPLGRPVAGAPRVPYGCGSAGASIRGVGHGVDVAVRGP